MDKKKIKQIMGGLRCPKEFRCVTSQCHKVCKAQDFGNDYCLICLEDQPYACPFSVLFGRTTFCQCPLRVYLEKTLRQSSKKKRKKATPQAVVQARKP